MKPYCNILQLSKDNVELMAFHVFVMGTVNVLPFDSPRELKNTRPYTRCFISYKHLKPIFFSSKLKDIYFTLAVK